MTHAGQAGFTLLEAMVAIIVLSMSLFASYSWIDVSVQSLVRSEQVFAQEMLVNEFSGRLAIVDLQDVQRGDMQIGEYTVFWSAEALETGDGVTLWGSEGLYNHTLYNVEVGVRQRGQLVAEHKTRLVSTKQVRQPRYER